MTNPVSLKNSYMEKDFCLERGPVDPAELDCLISRVKTTIERMFPTNPKIDTEVKRTPSMIKLLIPSFTIWQIFSNYVVLKCYVVMKVAYKKFLPWK